MACQTDYDTGSSSSTQYKNDNQDLLNRATTDLVYKLKFMLEDRAKRPDLIQEQDIEKYTVEAKKKLYPDQYDIHIWERKLSFDINDSSRDLLYLSMAYVQNPKQIEPIFERKKKEHETNKTKPPPQPIDTSLENIIDPLKQINTSRRRHSSENLFSIILNIKDDDIDYADRMFYSEACRLLGNSSGYTFDHAHDQVQAIRLTHYESDDRNELRRFIEKCRSFDEAYSYLQYLARERAAENSRSSLPNAAPPHSDRSQRSIVRQLSNGDPNISNHSPTSSGYNEYLYNKSPNDASYRPLSSSNRSKDNTGTGNDYYRNNSNLK